MDSKYRMFCPNANKCEELCEDCKLTKGELGHTINKNYSKSIGKKCMCSECCDR